MPMKLVVDADGTIHFAVDFYVVTVHGEDLHGVDGGSCMLRFSLSDSMVMPRIKADALVSTRYRG